ncbi:MAG: flagellar basal-body rod protein FlgG [Clostridiaceae bacterium]|jgi:flagellar basal-body rod protein FlgG|nr:flagellar basal-body rod protein FlgG [Clostridiaceae bacterium]
MMRALWTAASGMQAQQMNVDVIANNLANVNTTAFKKDRIEFKDLLYETMRRGYVMEDGGRPVNLQVGHGTTAVATLKDFATGNPEETGNPLDFFIDGDAFFMVQGPTGEVNYTRDGSFKLSITEMGNMLTTSEGYAVLDEMEAPIYIDVDLSRLMVSQNGELSYLDEDGISVPTGQIIGLSYFENRAGLESIGRNLYQETQASGFPIMAMDSEQVSLINQNFIESSNVKTVEEMVKLIIAQRAYELNSKAIQTSDDMLNIANNLKR